MAIIHVIIPCYKVEKTLEDAVFSVLNQPCREIDIVLVDDGSPGETPELCDRLAQSDPRVHVIHKKTNSGSCDTRNTGIEYALTNLVRSQREFIAFLDSDDCWCPNVFDDQTVDHLLTDWDEDIIAFSGILGNHDLTRFSGKQSNLEVSGAEARSMIWQAQTVTFAAKIYSVEIFSHWNVRFFPEYVYSEDKYFMLMTFALARTVRFLSTPLYIYRKNRAGLMGSAHRIAAKDYYLPIIDGWLMCDEFLNGKSAQTNHVSDAGQTLAAIYLVEMVAEHVKRGGRFSEIMEVFRSHPHYPATESGELVRSNPREYPINRLLFEHPMRFVLKYRLVGSVEWTLRQLLRIPLVAQLYDRRRYPHTELPK